MLLYTFSSTLSEERRHTALIKRAEQAEKNAMIQKYEGRKWFACMPSVSLLVLLKSSFLLKLIKHVAKTGGKKKDFSPKSKTKSSSLTERFFLYSGFVFGDVLNNVTYESGLCGV